MALILTVPHCHHPQGRDRQGKGQWVTEGVYGLVRNSLARDIIGSHDFLKFVPLLFSLFSIILVNNLFGIIRRSSTPR